MRALERSHLPDFLPATSVVWRDLHAIADPWQTLEPNLRNAMLETSVDTELLFRELQAARELNPLDENAVKSIMESERMSLTRGQLFRAQELAREKNCRLVDVPG